MSSRFLPRSGRRARPSLAVLAGALAVLGCNYGFHGGGGFPSHIRTIYVEPLTNETPQFELEQQLFSALLERLPRAFGARPASRELADAVVRGKITRYEDTAQNYRAGSETGGGTGVEVVGREVQIGLSIEIIDVQRNEIIWESASLVGRGAYQYGSGQGELEGRTKAVEHLVQQIIDGAQSQW
jgi:hypothetical protein